jgi:chemotaxis protein CheD
MKVYSGQSDAETQATPDRIKVGIAEYEVTTDGAVLTTSGLGSCIGVAIYDDSAPAAGLVHVMLPTAEDMEGNPAKFADTGVETLVEALEDAGADTEHMTAKLAGGSDMLDFSESGSGIGKRNVTKVREVLGEYGIPVEGEDVGGDHGRSLRLKGTSGELVVKSANRDAQTL